MTGAAMLRLRATLAGAAGITERPCAPRGGLPRRVAVTRLPDEAAEIARITGMPLGTVKSLILRAQSKLRQSLSAADQPTP